MKYEFIDEENKKKIIETQLAELEATHFSLQMAKPSQLADRQQYLAWEQQNNVIENTLLNLRSKRDQMFDPIDTRKPKDGEFWNIKTGKVEKIKDYKSEEE